MFWLVKEYWNGAQEAVSQKEIVTMSKGAKIGDTFCSMPVAFHTQKKAEDVAKLMMTELGGAFLSGISVRQVGCKGEKCTTINSANHSTECLAEHKACCNPKG